MVFLWGLQGGLTEAKLRLLLIYSLLLVVEQEVRLLIQQQGLAVVVLGGIGPLQVFLLRRALRIRLQLVGAVRLLLILVEVAVIPRHLLTHPQVVAAVVLAALLVVLVGALHKATPEARGTRLLHPPRKETMGGKVVLVVLGKVGAVEAGRPTQEHRTPLETEVLVAMERHGSTVIPMLAVAAAVMAMLV